MKKLLGILVLGLLWCNTAFADVFKFDCKQAPLKGINEVTHDFMKWTLDTNKKTLTYHYKYNDNFYKKNIGKIFKPEEGSRIENKGIIQLSYIDKTTAKWENNDMVFNYRTDGTVYYVGTEYDKGLETVCNLVSKDETTTKIKIASMIDKAKSTCKSLGFKEGTEKFVDCALKLYSQSVELAAEKNQTVVMQPQSSGSNVMTIYDPVRDSNALIKQGQRMLSGRCTLGIDC